MKYDYDPKCGDLARYFMGEKANLELIKELAQRIQGVVEDWMEDVQQTGAANAK